MEDYLNYNALVLMTIMLVGSISIALGTKTNDFGFSFVILVMIGFILLDANSEFETAKSNEKEFKKGATLKCYSGGGLYSGSTTYRVSKKDGWDLDDKYFVKESVAIKINKCDK